MSLLLLYQVDCINLEWPLFIALLLCYTPGWRLDCHCNWRIAWTLRIVYFRAKKKEQGTGCYAGWHKFPYSLPSPPSDLSDSKWIERERERKRDNCVFVSSRLSFLLLYRLANEWVSPWNCYGLTERRRTTECNCRSQCLPFFPSNHHFETDKDNHELGAYSYFYRLYWSDWIEARLSVCSREESLLVWGHQGS